MRTVQLAAVFVTTFWASTSHARIEPSFDELACAWHATDVVLASRSDEEKSRFVVRETWKGDLKPKQEISVDDVTGEHVVLFLRRDENGKATWLPAARHGGMRLSTAWVDGDSVSAFIQVHRGPPELAKLKLDYRAFKERVTGIVSAEQELRDVNDLKDISDRSKGLASHTRRDNYYVRKEAFRLLGKCGPGAIPTLREMLSDDSLTPRHGDVIKALAEAGGDDVVDDLIELTERELDYWRSKAPTLKVGWWNGKGLPWKEVNVVRNRYVKILEVFYAFERRPNAKCRESVTNFRDFWRSLPQLEDKSGLTQMSEACDKVLAKIGH